MWGRYDTSAANKLRGVLFACAAICFVCMRMEVGTHAQKGLSRQYAKLGCARYFCLSRSYALLTRVLVVAATAGIGRGLNLLPLLESWIRVKVTVELADVGAVGNRNSIGNGFVCIWVLLDA